MLYTLFSADLAVSITNYGARMVSMIAAEAPGSSIILGYDDVSAYEADPAFLGACCGRYANRIFGASYEIDGERFTLPANAGSHTLHGGPSGFFACLWEPVSAAADHLTLHLISPDGDQGFGGHLEVEAHFALSGDEFSVSYSATTDRPTPVSLTHHPYFNLMGAGEIHDHHLQVPARAVMGSFTDPANAHRLHGFSDRPELDFTAPTRIGDKLERCPEGIDHTYAVEAGCVSTLSHPDIRRQLTVSSDMPALQVYTAASLGGGPPRPGGAPYRPFEGICLEPQAFPDSPNYPAFPSTILRPGEVYRRRITYRYR